MRSQYLAHAKAKEERTREQLRLRLRLHHCCRKVTPEYQSEPSVSDNSIRSIRDRTKLFVSYSCARGWGRLPHVLSMPIRHQLVVKPIPTVHGIILIHCMSHESWQSFGALYIICLLLKQVEKACEKTHDKDFPLQVQMCSSAKPASVYDPVKFAYYRRSL